MRNRTCNACGWVHVGVTRAMARSWGPDEEIRWEACFHCGGSYKNMRDSKPSDCPRGCTMQPIIVEEV